MGRLPFVLGVLIPLIAQSPGPQDKSPQRRTFRSDVELVTLDAIVVDKDGHPVTGLTPDDFIVTLEGQVRPVRLLDYREYGHDTTSSVPPGATVTTTPQPVRQSRGGRIVVLAVDPGNALRTRLAEGGTSFGVPMEVGAEMRRDPIDASQIEMDVSVEVPGSVTGRLTLMYGLMDEKGNIANVGREQLPPANQSDYQAAFPIRVTTGRYRLRVAASDANGRIGSVEKPVSAALARAGSYASSDLLTACTDAHGASKLVTLDTLPHDARTLIVRLELYPEGPGVHGVLQVRFELLQSGKRSVVATGSLTPSVSGGTRVAAASLPIQGLGAGSYTIRATVFENGAEVGTESAPFRKE